uniref:Selenoprotein K n=1 Tax=Sus scrofa TaxID=9823 RepID=A0A8D0SWG9_PIG
TLVINNASILASKLWQIYHTNLRCSFGRICICGLFFRTLLQQDMKKRTGYRSSSDSRHDDGRGPPGNPLSKMGPINHLCGLNPPPVGGE